MYLDDLRKSFHVEPVDEDTTRADRHVLGQLRPGDHVRLLRREHDEAVQELREKIAYWSEWLPDAAVVIA